MELFEMAFVGSPKGLMEYIGKAICEYCHGTGLMKVSVHFHGYNLAPDGMYEYEDRVCLCKLPEPDYCDDL